MGIGEYLKKLFNKKEKKTLDTKNKTSGIELVDLSGFMTGQLVALFKKTRVDAYKKEYIRRLTYINFTPVEALNMFEYELKILKNNSKELLCSDGYLRWNYFDLKNIVLQESKEFYIQNQYFLCSEITKIWDEAEWHLAYNHEKNMDERVWSEIFRLSRNGGAELFIEYMTDMAAKTKIDINKLRSYNIAEQKLLFKYKWYAGDGRAHPYAADKMRESLESANKSSG